MREPDRETWGEMEKMGRSEGERVRKKGDLMKQVKDKERRERRLSDTDESSPEKRGRGVIFGGVLSIISDS